MLTPLRPRDPLPPPAVPMGEARFPAPFFGGLAFNLPVHGTWNIVHIGMLLPEAHQIYVCAENCMRGVVLTAAEMNALDRYSAIMIREENVLDGSMEKLMIDGVADILKKLPYRPRAILLFISCQHFFLAYDQQIVFQTLRERYPDIRFADCYMIPTLRKSGMTPDQKMRIQLYSMLEPLPEETGQAALIGSNLPLDASCELPGFLKERGIKLLDLHSCRNFDEYLKLAKSGLFLYYEPLAHLAAKDLEKRLGRKSLYLPFSFDFDQIRENYEKLAGALGAAMPEKSWLEAQKAGAKEALERARKKISDTRVAIDHTFTFRILSFARMLLSCGFHVTEIYADRFLPEEKEDFEWIREHAPEVLICACSRPVMRVLPRERERKILAIGQKAAYFTGTDYFVDVAESGGLYGYGGIRRIAQLMEEAFEKPKDHKKLIQKKGYGCESCI